MASPQSVNNCERLVNQRGSFAHRCCFAHRPKSPVVQVAQPDAQDHSTLRQVIESCQLASYLPRSSPGQSCDFGPESDTRSRASHSRKAYPRVDCGSAGMVDDVVLEEYCVPSCLLRLSCEIGE